MEYAKEVAQAIDQRLPTKITNLMRQLGWNAFGIYEVVGEEIARHAPPPVFAYHTLYTLAQIETLAGRRATHSPAMSGLPHQASVIGPDWRQYDFCGHDDDHLVLLWIDDERHEVLTDG